MPTLFEFTDHNGMTLRFWEDDHYQPRFVVDSAVTDSAISLRPTLYDLRTLHEALGAYLSDKKTP